MDLQRLKIAQRPWYSHFCYCWWWCLYQVQPLWWLIEQKGCKMSFFSWRNSTRTDNQDYYRSFPKLQLLERHPCQLYGFDHCCHCYPPSKNIPLPDHAPFCYFKKKIAVSFLQKPFLAQKQRERWTLHPCVTLGGQFLGRGHNSTWHARLLSPLGEAAAS